MAEIPEANAEGRTPNYPAKPALQPRAPRPAQEKLVTHRDQIHTDVHYDRLSVSLLDSEALQRLGRVYQLGYAHLVYRGGTHTRLSHVMGTAFKAVEIVESLRTNYRSSPDFWPPHVATPADFLPCPDIGNVDLRWNFLRDLVVWASLLHDLGHIPLGHTLEDEFDGIYLKHDDFLNPRLTQLWIQDDRGANSEIRTILTDKDLFPSSARDVGLTPQQLWQTLMIICLYKEDRSTDASAPGSYRSLKDILETSLKDRPEPDPSTMLCQELLRAIQQTEDVFRPYMTDIVSNTLCADYLDYVQRDPANVGLDVLRDTRVVSRFYIAPDPSSGQPRMALALVDHLGRPHNDTCTGVVELVRQRFRFAEIIYYHKTKVAASAMFAKAMKLIGELPEVRDLPAALRIDQLDALEDRICSQAGQKEVARLRKAHLERSLLDPDVGDEGLHLLMQQRAIEEIEKGRREGNRTKVRSCLRGLSLLHGIARRRLYKVMLSIDAHSFNKLTYGARQENEARIRTMLHDLRKSHERRAELEQLLAQAGKLPEDAILLYVPPRKSQAKGIETFAIQLDGVTQLGRHRAVEGKVEQLNQDYKDLWRILVLVHPQYRHEVVRLSKVADCLAAWLWKLFQPIGQEEVEDGGSGVSAALETAIAGCAWFDYIGRDSRPAAEHLQTLCGATVPEWTYLNLQTSEPGVRVTYPEQAQRAFMVSEVVGHLTRATTWTPARMRGVAKRYLKDRYPLAGALETAVDDIQHDPDAIRNYRGSESGELFRDEEPPATESAILSGLAIELFETIKAAESLK